MEAERTNLVRAAGAVGAVAAGLRVAWVLVASRRPLGLRDPAIYLDAAASIARGDGYRSLLGESTAYYPPGYPFFLGAVQRVTDAVGLGAHLVLVTGLAQAVLGGVAAAALVVAGARSAGSGPDGVRLGVVAGLLFACWPNLIIHSSLVLSESLFLALFCVLLASTVVLLTSDRPPAPPVLATLVVSAALATWVRPQAALVVLPATFLAVLAARRGWRASVRLAAWPLLGIVVAIVPWTLRNAVVMDAFVPMSTNTGDNLCIGFHDGAEGGFAIADACATDGRYVDGPDVEVARDAELRRRAVDWIGANPGALPGLTAAKLRVTFADDTDGLSAWESYGDDRHLSDATRSTLRWISNLYYWAVGLAALAGTVVAARRWWNVRRHPDGAGESGAWTFVVLVAVAQALVPVAFFGDERFKIPVAPSMVLLAALALMSLPALRGRPAVEPR